MIKLELTHLIIIGEVRTENIARTEFQDNASAAEIACAFTEMKIAVETKELNLNPPAKLNKPAAVEITDEMIETIRHGLSNAELTRKKRGPKPGTTYKRRAKNGRRK